MIPRPRVLPIARVGVAALMVALLAPSLPPSALSAQDSASRPGVRIGLTYETSRRPGVLVLPVAGEGGDSVRALLQRDLDFGDRVLVTGQELTTPVTGALNYPLYARLGAAAVVQATLRPDGGLHLVLHDVAAAAVANVADIALPAPRYGPAWRMAVHGASDELERWVTGTRGSARTRVAFVRDGQLWLVDADGANATPLPGTAGALSPAWHPSGRWVAHGSLGDAGASIVVRDLASGTARRAAGGSGTFLTPAFSPDGGTLVFAAGEDGTDLFAVNPFAGGTPRRVTVGRGSTNASPTFSPDGRRLAFTSGRMGHPEVYISDVDGTNTDLLTSTGFGDQLYRANPAWSPDGRTVAFQSQLGGLFQVMTISLRDRSVRQLTSEGRNEDPAWAPDGRHLVFTSSRTGSKQLWVLDVETGRARQLTRGAPARMPAWSPWLDQP